jgi:hypothetical protein
MARILWGELNISTEIWRLKATNPATGQVFKGFNSQVGFLPNLHLIWQGYCYASRD